jgi:hypothetical protein
LDDALSQIGEQITSIISRALYFTTKSGGIWEILHHVCGAGAEKGCAHVLLTEAVRRNDPKLTAVCITFCAV